MFDKVNNPRSESLLRIYCRKIYWRIKHSIYDRASVILRKILNPEVPISDDLAYYNWLIQNHTRKADLKKMADSIDAFAYQPQISIIVPVYDTPEDFLREMIESVLSQVYPYWELCICDDASPSSHVKKILSEYAAKDSRIKVIRNTANKHISHTSNSAIEIASGEFISLLDHDDLLTPDALYEVVLLLNQHPEADMIYSDEDKILPDKSLNAAFFKPDWCPDKFLSNMYTCHLGTYRLSLVREVGGFRPGYEGSQDYDLVLRFTEKTDKIFHIPKILYHWRIHPDSTSGGSEAKPYADDAGKLALNDALSRREVDGTVTSVASLPCCYTIRYKITEYKLVSIIISVSNSASNLDRCLNSIFTQTLYPNYEVCVMENGTNNLDIQQTVNRWLKKEPNRFKFYALNATLNSSELNNYSVAQTSGNYILFLNSALQVITPEWIEALVEQVQRDSIGAAGALLLNPDDTIYHAGIIIDRKELVRYGHQQLPSTSGGYFGCVKTINNYSAVSIDCLMCRRSVFDSVGGFSVEFSQDLSGVDICLKILEKGYKNIYLPHVILYSYESARNLSNDLVARKIHQERSSFQKRWQHLLDRDPCYGNHFALKDTYYGAVIKKEY